MIGNLVTSLEALSVTRDAVRSQPVDRCLLGKDCPSFGAAIGRQRSGDLDSEEARAEALDRRRLQQDLKNAASTGGFVLYYQPKLHLKSGLMRGTEAVIRMLILMARSRGAVATRAILREDRRTVFRIAHRPARGRDRLEPRIAAVRNGPRRRGTRALVATLRTTGNEQSGDGARSNDRHQTFQDTLSS